MKLLYVEDDIATAQTVALMMKAEGFKIDLAENGNEGLEQAFLIAYDVILLDINLPDISGYKVLEALRREKFNTGIIMLSGLAAIEDKVKALNLGADDYITKPFHRDELAARIRAVHRRKMGKPDPNISIGNVNINLNDRAAKVAGKNLHLTGKEYDLLELLCVRKGRLQSKEQIMNALYDDPFEVEPKMADIWICKVRDKLRAAGAEGLHIHTQWGKGYYLSEKEEAMQ